MKETIRWYYKYLDYYYRCKKENKIISTFYTWLVENTKYITDYNNLLRIYQIFNNDDLKEWDNMDIPDKKMDLLLINEIMKKC